MTSIRSCATVTRAVHEGRGGHHLDPNGIEKAFGGGDVEAGADLALATAGAANASRSG